MCIFTYVFIYFFFDELYLLAAIVYIIKLFEEEFPSSLFDTFNVGVLLHVDKNVFVNWCAVIVKCEVLIIFNSEVIKSNRKMLNISALIWYHAILFSERTYIEFIFTI